jgi:type I restriction enzyme S subunit
VPTHILFDRELPLNWHITTVDAIKAEGSHTCVAGPFGSNISSKYFEPTGVPVIRGGNLTDDLTRFVPKNFVFVSRERAASYRAQHVAAGDLVFTCWGTVGQVGLIPEKGPYPEYIISNKQLKLRPNKNLVDQLYLFYYFASPQMVAHIRNRAIGAAVPGINLGIPKALEIVLPPLAQQRRIASILSAYDDLIENNTRRIAILEEMARRIYEEWFVRFRFPGHEGVRMVESELGLVPEGWKPHSMSELTVIHRGRSYKGTELADTGGLPFINLKCMMRDGGYKASGLKRYTGIFKKSQTVRTGEIVMAITDMTQERRIVAHVGRVSRLDAEFGVFSMDLVRVEPRDHMPDAYIYAMLRWSGFSDQVKQHANGANVLHLLPARIEEYRLICPAPEVIKNFGAIASPIFSMCDALEQKNINLRATRDLLLPKLISGELDVSNMPDPAQNDALTSSAVLDQPA